MNILQILPSLETGGAERAAVDVAAALVKAGHTAYVASSGGRMVGEVTAAGATHIQMPANSKNPFIILLNAARLKLFIRAHNIDIIHARSRAPAWSAYFAAKSCKIPFVTTFHAAYKGTSPFKKLYNGIMAKGDRIIAISQFIAHHIRDNYGVDPMKITAVPRGIDFARYNQAAVDETRRAKLRAELQLNNKPLIILPGRLSPIKGQALAIEALAQLPTREFQCLIIGPDQGRSAYRQELIALVERHNISQQIKFVEHTDLLAAYALADLVLSPSQVAEGFGRVPVEAQAFGAPVIATALGATSETVLDNVTGWLVPPGDVSALSGAIQTVLALSPERRREMAETAVRHVRGHFTLETMCALTLAVYAGAKFLK